MIRSNSIAVPRPIGWICGRPAGASPTRALQASSTHSNTNPHPSGLRRSAGKTTVANVQIPASCWNLARNRLTTNDVQLHCVGARQDEFELPPSPRLQADRSRLRACWKAGEPPKPDATDHSTHNPVGTAVETWDTGVEVVGRAYRSCLTRAVSTRRLPPSQCFAGADAATTSDRAENGSNSCPSCSRTRPLTIGAQ